MEFGNPPVIEFTRALGCVGEAARENAVTVAGGGPFTPQSRGIILKFQQPPRTVEACVKPVKLCEATVKPL